MTETRNNYQDVHDVTQLEMSLTKSFVCIVGWLHNKELKYSVTQITHCLDNNGMFCFSLQQHMKLNF